MVTKKTYKILDNDGLGIRLFRSKSEAEYFINNKPNFIIEVIRIEVESSYEKGLRVCGECLL